MMEVKFNLAQINGEKVTDIGQKFAKEDLSGEGKIVKKGKKIFNRIIAK